MFLKSGGYGFVLWLMLFSTLLGQDSAGGAGTSQTGASQTGASRAGEVASSQQFRPRTETVLTQDGVALSLTYWPSELLQEAPVVVLVHGARGSRRDWPQDFLARLHAKGYAIVAPDLRGHGETRLPPYPAFVPALVRSQQMVTYDLGAVKQFLLQENQRRHLNMGKTGMIGAEFGANLAIQFSAADWLEPPFSDAPLGYETRRGQDVRALVLLSPQVHPAGMPTVPALQLLKSRDWGIAFLMCVGGRDPEALAADLRLFHTLGRPIQNRNRIYFENLQTRAEGISLLEERLRTQQYVLAFLERHLLALPGKWEDRASRIGRPWAPPYAATAE